MWTIGDFGMSGYAFANHYVENDKKHLVCCLLIRVKKTGTFFRKIGSC